MLLPTDILSLWSWVLIGVTIFLARQYVIQKWRHLDKLGIPHDPPSILKMGHTTDFLFNNKLAKDLEGKEEYGPVWGYYMFLTPRIVIHDVSILQQILVKEFATFSNRQTNLTQTQGKELGNSLMFICDQQWKRVRSTMTPTFSSSKLKQMCGIVDQCTENTVAVFRKRNLDSNGTFNATRIFSHLSMDVICAAAFSTNVNSQDDTCEEPEITIQAKNLFGAGFVNFVAVMCVMFPFLQPLAAEYLSRKSYNVYFRKLTTHLMEQRRKHGGSVNRVDLMQLMLESEVPEETIQNGITRGMTRPEIIGSSMLMILAGYETTGNTMTYLAYNLAQHPDIQKELQKEVDGLYETMESIDYDAVNSLKLLDMCLNETLRLYSPISRTMRTAKKEITINGLTISAGQVIIIAIYTLGHDPEFWDEPMKFNPERMRDMSRINPMTFNPFGAGPRNCIGLRFAIMEVKMAFCQFLHNFTFKTTDSTPKPPLKLKFDVTVHPLKEFHLCAESRN